MSKQEDFHRPEKPLEKTPEIDNEARISKKAGMKRKFNRNQKRTTLADIQLGSLIFLLYLNLTRKHIELRSNLFPFVLMFYQLKRFRFPRFLRFLMVTYQSNSRYSISTLFFFSPLILFRISFLFKDLIHFFSVTYLSSRFLNIFLSSTFCFSFLFFVLQVI